MSNSLNIYLKRKENPEGSPLLFMSFSRNHPIYHVIEETIAPVYVLGEEVYTELTPELLTECINTLDRDIEHIISKINEYEKSILKNPKKDIIEQLVEYKEMFNKMEDNSSYLTFMRWFTNDIINGYSDFSKVLCNIT